MPICSVPPTRLIEAVAKDFEKKAEKPAWAGFVKTGCSRERAPLRSDWYYVRMASLLYRLYADGPRGTESFRKYYGGRKRRGVKTEHARKASGKVVRSCLQQLEKEGLIMKLKKGRAISHKGGSYLYRKSKEISEIMKKDAAEKAEKQQARPSAEGREAAAGAAKKGAAEKEGGSPHQKEQAKEAKVGALGKDKADESKLSKQPLQEKAQETTGRKAEPEHQAAYAMQGAQGRLEVESLQSQQPAKGKAGNREAREKGAQAEAAAE